MAAIQKWQIKTIYALAGAQGLVERGNRQDNLHLLVDAQTGKSSVSALSAKEADKVIDELRRRAQTGGAPARSKRKHQEKPGGVTAGQQRKVWALMYELAKLDEAPASAALGGRLAGIIKRELNIDATARTPFAWLNYQQGGRLIEVLKGYVASAQRKTGKARSGAG